MNTDKLVEALEELPDGEILAGAEEETRRFFIFRVGDSSYALHPESIREIVSDLAIYALPACPPYIPGLVNCHGQPHTVYDLRVLFENERLEAKQFLVINAPGDSVAFACSEVEEIAEIPASALTEFADRDGEARFFQSMIVAQDRRIPVLSIPDILGALEADLA